MKKIISFLLIGILILGVTGCGSNSGKTRDNNEKTPNNNVDNTLKTEETKEDNKELVDLLNNTVNELLEYSKTNEFKVFDPRALYKIEDTLKEKGIKNYVFLAICDKKFTEKVELNSFAYTAELIPNYDGKCTYSTWSFDDVKYNTGEDRYTLVKDTNTNNYYNIRISFEKTKHYDKDKYYPVFSNSELLK